MVGRAAGNKSIVPILRILPFLLVLSAFVPAAASAAPAAPAKLRCKENQSRTVTFKWHYEHYTQRIDPQHIKDGPKNYIDQQDGDFATLQIGGAACKAASGWRVIKPVAVGYGSAGLSADGDLISSGKMKGWGIGIDGGQGGSAPKVSVRLLHCGKKNWLGAVKVLNEVPIPGLSYGVDLLKAIAGQFLPDDKVKCANRGRVRLQVSASKKGNLRVSVRNKGTTEQSYAANDYQRNVEQFVIVDPAVG